MLEWLVGTHGDVVPLVLRLTLAVVMFAHGAQKALGWFGGSGLRGTLDVLRKSGVSSPVAVLAIMAEFLGPLGLAVGLLTRVAALGIAAAGVRHAGGSFRSLRNEGFDLRACPIVDGHIVTGFQQVRRHTSAHMPQTDEPDLHGNTCFSSMRLTRGALRLHRSASRSRS